MSSIMYRTSKHIILTIIAAFLLVGCNNGLTLQRYFVDNQETKNFITQDLPVSMLKINESELTPEQKIAYESVNRLNFLGYKVDSTNIDIFNSEIAKVKSILKDKKYNKLIDFSYQGAKVSVNYVGDETDADEVIIFGSSKDMGFGIVRVLGHDMSPEKMMTLGELFKNADLDKSQFDNVMNFFK